MKTFLEFLNKDSIQANLGPNSVDDLKDGTYFSAWTKNDSHHISGVFMNFFNLTTREVSEKYENGLVGICYCLINVSGKLVTNEKKKKDYWWCAAGLVDADGSLYKITPPPEKDRETLERAMQVLFKK